MVLRLAAFFAIVLIFSTTSNHASPNEKPAIAADTGYLPGTFGYDRQFLQQHDSVVVLQSGDARVIVSPKYQAKVFTSTVSGDTGLSFGWINYKAFGGNSDPHMNAYGGENRIWLGPEGGKYALSFPPGATMGFATWTTPAPFDSEPWTVKGADDRSVRLTKDMQLTNYAGVVFTLTVDRTVIILDRSAIDSLLGLTPGSAVKAVGYRTVNQLTNKGKQPWTEAGGTACLWLLDMLKTSPATTIVIPYTPDPAHPAARPVTTDYFGEIAPDRIRLDSGVIYFRADGNSRGKLGVHPAFARPVTGSYDAVHRVLTITLFDVDPHARYLNQEWNHVKPPYSGDAVNAYNDGKLADGSQIGPFYELESVAPAAFLAPGQTQLHRHTVLHFTGPEQDLDVISRKMLGVSIEKIKGIWRLPGLPGAHWVTYPLAEDSVHPCPVFRKRFAIGKPIRSATLLITAHGLYEARINGRRVGDGYFTPGWTSYDKRLQYQRYDVTRLLQKQNEGSNELRVTIGDGWWRGVYGNDLKNNRYGKDAGLLLELEIDYANGTKDFVRTDSSWETAQSNILYSSIYHGEIVDENKPVTHWVRAREEKAGMDNLVPTIGPPVRPHERFRPVRIFTDTRGEQVIDFGQNMAGWVQVKIRGRAGDTIRLSYVEALDKDGNVYRGSLREAKAADVFIVGAGDQRLEPHFTYHGFRYVRAEGFTATRDNCTAVAVYSDLAHAGTFSCSNAMINQLQHNINWSLNSNMVDIPTDCPQRTERLGWSGDAAIFCRTAAFNRDVQAFFSKWLADLSADQGINGGVPSIIPDLYRHADSVKRGVAAWGDAATIVPWTLFEVYGDTGLLVRQYPSMKAWVEYIVNSSADDLWRARTYGDWFTPGDSTSTAFIDQCYFYYSTSLLLRAAEVLHRDEDVARYSPLLARVRQAFLRTYGGFDTRATRTQTAYALALAFDLLPENDRPRYADSLAERIAANQDHLATGFLGTPFLLPVLTRFGHEDLAWRLLLQPTCPSWLYPLTKGATTIWEKWDAIRPDGSFDTCSLNHYAYGAVGQWLYETVAGITPLAPGYKKIRIAPHPGGGVTWVKAGYRCRFGVIRSDWRIKGRRIVLTVDIPEGTRATIEVPAGQGHERREVGPGHYRLTGFLPTAHH